MTTPAENAPKPRRFYGKPWLLAVWGKKLWRSIAVLALCAVCGFIYVGKLDLALPVKSWAFWPIALMWLYNAVFFAAAFSVGVRVLTLLKIGGTALERFAFAIPLGVIVFCLSMYGLGAARLFNRPAALALAAALIASGAGPSASLVRRALERWSAPRPYAEPLSRLVIGRAAVGYGVICLGLLYLPVLTPESLNYDAQWCHLTVAQDYAREGRIIPYDGDYARNHPQLAPLLHTWFWLMPVPTLQQRWTLPLHTEFFMVVFTLAGVAATVRYLLRQRRAPSAWVGFFLFPAIFVYDMNLGGSSDHFFGLFTAPLFMAVARAATSFSRKYLILTALLGGGALLTKYQAAYILPVCALVIALALLARTVRKLWRARRARSLGRGQLWSAMDLRAPALNMLLAGGVFAVVVAPHFLRNWVFYNNPVYPFMQGVFDSKPGQPDAVYWFENVFQDYNWRPHGTLAQRIQSSFKLLATFSFHPSYYFFRPDWPNFGSLFTFAIPFVLFVRSRPRLLLGTFVSLGAIFTWAMTFRVERNLQGFVPIIAATTVALLVRAWGLGWFARVGVGALIALQLIWHGDALFYSQYGRLTTVINSFRSGYERSSRPPFTHPLVEAEATLPPDAKILYHQNRPTLGLNRVVALDLIGSQALVSYAKVSNTREMVEEWKRVGMTHVLYDQPTIFGRETRKLEVLFQLLLREAGPGRRFGNYGLIDLRKLPQLSDEEGLRVVAIAAPGYRDGVYLLDQMNVVELLPPHLRVYPNPIEPIPTDEAQVEALFEGVAAVIMTGSGPAPVRDVMQRRGWSAVQSYSGYFSVYLPRGDAPESKRRRRHR